MEGLLTTNINILSSTAPVVCIVEHIITDVIIIIIIIIIIINSSSTSIFLIGQLCLINVCMKSVQANIIFTFSKRYSLHRVGQKVSCCIAGCKFVNYGPI